ncbi:MAG: uracil-DNA glycosylase [Bacteroidota bacterium]
MPPAAKLPEWNELLKPEYDKEYFKKLTALIDLAYQNHEVFPPKNLILNAIRLCTFNDVKVVLIGQDPYHNYGQACGLSFSVNDGVGLPPSLKNIFKELANDIPGFTIPNSGNLEPWARQGVLLLNSVLTVQANLPGSHKNFGWQQFTDKMISLVNDHKEHVVFLLWGNYAMSKASLINSEKHLVLTAAHPSPLARGAFFGSRHFSKTNAYLTQHQLPPIAWNLT